MRQKSSSKQQRLKLLISFSSFFILLSQNCHSFISHYSTYDDYRQTVFHHSFFPFLLFASFEVFCAAAFASLFHFNLLLFLFVWFSFDFCLFDFFVCFILKWMYVHRYVDAAAYFDLTEWILWFWWILAWGLWLSGTKYYKINWVFNLKNWKKIKKVFLNFLKIKLNILELFEKTFLKKNIEKLKIWKS